MESELDAMSKLETMFLANVVIEDNTVIGNDVILESSGVIVGSDGFGYTQTEEGSHKLPQIGHVIIEDDVEIGANTTVDRASMGSTVIGKGSKIDNLVQIILLKYKHKYLSL